MEKKSLAELIQQTKDALRRLNYSECIIKQDLVVYDKLLAYAHLQSVSEFSESLGARFLAECYKYTRDSNISDLPSGTAEAVRAVRRLGEYQLYGGFHRRYAIKATTDWALDDVEIIEAFIKHMATIDTVEKTKKTNLFRIQKYYDFLKSRGLTSVRDTTFAVLSDYALSMQGDSKRYAQDKLSTLRHFLRYLYNHGHIPTDFTSAVPKVIAPRRKNIPAMWSRDDVSRLLSSIDRASPAGKRDYAVIMLTAGLGLRASDIGSLKLQDINWMRKEIEVSQHKTGKINVCPLTDEAGWALIDYIRDARPESDLPFVFLTCNAPYTGFGDTTAVSVLKRQMQRAGIHEKPGVNYGMHSLRHTLARCLLDENVPLPLIADIMGHTEVVSSSPYLKIDVNGLRECALSLGEVRRYAATSNI